MGCKVGGMDYLFNEFRVKDVLSTFTHVQKEMNSGLTPGARNGIPGLYDVEDKQPIR
jgi:hypothetical protein